MENKKKERDCFSSKDDQSITEPERSFVSPTVGKTIRMRQKNIAQIREPVLLPLKMIKG